MPTAAWLDALRRSYRAACALGLGQREAAPYPDWAGLPEGLLLQMFEIMTHLDDGRDLVRRARAGRRGAAPKSEVSPGLLRPVRRAQARRRDASRGAEPPRRGCTCRARATA
jgi:hypothetical protein